MGNPVRRWYISIEQHPTITVARFGYMSPSSGHQVWDEVAWPLSIEEWTERAILAELYDVALVFMESRA